MISIVLPFYKKLKDFERVLPLNHRYFSRPWVEVLVALDENESEAGLIALMGQYPDIRWKILVNDHPHPWRPPCKAINVGIRHASHDRVLVCSPESLFVTDVPAQAIHTMITHPRGVAVGRVAFGTYTQLEALGATAVFDAVAPARPHPFTFYGSIACARREFEAIRGYDESFRDWGGDDDNVRVRLAMNGAQLLACPEMKLLHLSDEARGSNRAFSVRADLRKCSPSQASASPNADWGRSFSRVAQQPASQAATLAGTVPTVVNPAVPIPSRQRCRVCGRYVLAQSALPFCVHCLPPEDTTRPETPRILCVMQVRNEARYLPGCLDHLRRHVDGFIILNDGSTDQTPDIIRAEPKLLEALDNPATSPHTWDERINKQKLLGAARRHQADWVLICDADERFETKFLQGLHVIAGSLDQVGFQMLTVAFCEVWGRPDRYRIDGIWGEKAATRLIRLPEHISFSGTRQLHDSWIPESMRQLENQPKRHATLYYHLYHLKMIHAADRIKRRDLYQRLDPGNQLQAQGYGYLTEEGESLETEHITPRRGYDSSTLPSDLQAMLSGSKMSR